MLYVLLGMTGILLSITETFALHCNRKTVGGLTWIFCIAVTMLLSGKRKKRKWMAAGLEGSAVLGLFFLSGGRCSESFRYIIGSVNEQLEEYMGVALLGRIDGGAAEADLGLLVLLFLLTGLFAYSVVCMRHVWIEGILLGISFSLPFLIGKVPDDITGAILIGTFVGIVSYKAVERKKTGLVSVGIAVAALGIGMMFPGPQLTKAFKNPAAVRSEIENFWEKNLLSHLEGRGGVNAGTVGRVGKFGEDDSEQLRLKNNIYPDDMYLKGYIGAEYRNNKWIESDASAFKRWARFQHTSAQEVLDTTIPESLNGILKEKLHVENIGANKKYRYMPYGGIYENELRLHGDTYIYAQREETYDVGYFPAYNVMELWNEKEPSEVQLAYEKYVKKTYCDVPDHIQKAFRRVVKERIKGRDAFSVIEEVVQLLNEEAVYSVEPGKTPAGKDVAEYFFFENKRGYCEHFATTAVLLLRMKGIPARYVSGYKVNGGQFHKKGNADYEAVVTGKSAHAWAEVYIPNVGWMPVEATPAYAGPVQTRPDKESKPEEAKENIPPKEEKKEEPIPEEQDVKETTAENGQKQTNGVGDVDGPVSVSGMMQKNRIGWIVIGFVIAGVAVCLFRIRSIRKQNQAERKADVRERTKLLFHKIYRMLVRAKAVKAEDASDEEVIRAICDRCPDVTEKEAEQLLEIVYRANFGKEKIKREEYQLCRDIYCTMKKAEKWKKI